VHAYILVANTLRRSCDIADNACRYGEAQW
jgi:hypothetical protein